jgi:two-component system nitrogen regulation sensor histidine kinase GlnL
MARAIASSLLRRRSGPLVDHGAVLNAVPDPIFAVDNVGAFIFLNLAAEQFFGASESVLLGKDLKSVLPEDSPVFSLISLARDNQTSIREYGLTLETPRIGSHTVMVDVAAITDVEGAVTICLKEMSIARKFDNQLTSRSAARSVTAMGAMLAHEVKNPLSGIKGAAQLLESNLSEEDAELTRLICEESDRIVELVNRMEMFADSRPIERAPLNIHEVLERVRRLAETGVAKGVTFKEAYDPSLPPVLGNRDLLIQAILNLVKNAAEALVGLKHPEIQLSTRYQQGVRLAVPGSKRRVDLPLVVSIQDNGPGIPEDLKRHLFDPFVTSKPSGKGLGLALVAKIIGDHGGIIEYDSDSAGTTFRIMLPVAREGRGK